MQITNKQKYILAGGGVLLVSIAVAVPLIVQSTKQKSTSFNLSIIKNEMQMATKSKATLEETKVAIGKMYQNGTPAKLSPQTQKAAHALAQYIHKHKTSKKFAFVLGKDHQGQHLLLLTIANHPAKTKANTSLQRVIQQAPSSPQKQDDLFSIKQLSWVTSALHKAEFGILFWIYQHRLSGQAAIAGTNTVPAAITAVNFQRVKTPREQLQDQAWVKIMQVVHDLTSSKLKIHGDAEQLPSQTKITARTIVLAIQKIISDDDEISKATQKLIKADHIEVQPDDKTGAMMITIKNYGHDKIITIFGFKATATLLEVARAKIKAAKDGANLPTRLNQVFYGQIPTISDVSVPMKEGVTFKFQSATTVNNQGESTFIYVVDANPQVEGTTTQDVTFVVSGFETQAQAAERLAAQAKINAAQNKIAVTSPTRLKQVLHGQIPIVTDVNAPLKNGVIFTFKSATAINNSGASTLTYEVDADPQIDGTMPKDVTFVVSGFETKALKDAKVAIQNLIIANFRTGIDKDQIASVGAPDKADVISDIKKQINNRDVQALILPGDITITPDNTAQTITIVIHNHGPSKTITIVGFISIKDYLDQLLNAIPSSGGPWVIPKGITSSQFNTYVQAMGVIRGMNNLARQYRAKITSLTIPTSFTMIGSWFKDFNKITSLHIPNSVTTIGGYAFQYAQLRSLTIPDSVITIEGTSFGNSPLTSLTLGNQLQTIEGYAFYHAQLKSLRIPNSVTTIGSSVFFNSPLTSLTLGDHLQTIGGDAFKGALLTLLHIPSSVTTIRYGAFGLSPLTSVNIFKDVDLAGGAFKSGVIINRPIRPS